MQKQRCMKSHTSFRVKEGKENNFPIGQREREISSAQRELSTLAGSVHVFPKTM